MGAGESARWEAEASTRLARELKQASDDAERRARNFSKGGEAEEYVAGLLGALGRYEIHALHDRRWPGTRSANIDHLVVGTSGVFVIDTKNWSEGVHVSQGVLYRGQSCCDEDINKLLRMTDDVRLELVEDGLTPNHVVPIMAFFGQTIPAVNVQGVWLVGADELPRFILLRGKLFTQVQVERLLSRLLAACPPATSTPAGVPPQPTSGSDQGSAEDRQGALLSRADLDDAALDAAMRAPLADWMTFLHPDQARLVKRSLNGPSRISGPAGTGKSVVALHRMAFLAERRSNRLLYVTFVKTVPRVLAQAYLRLSPHTADRVDFMSLHSWAFHLLRDRGMARSVNQEEVNRAFDTAWAAVGRGSVLEAAAPLNYWREEVDRVIRGRCLTHIDSYLDLERLGRGSRLGSNQRREVWRLLEAYEAELNSHRLSDWNDLLRLARDEVRRRPLDVSYDVVVLDEAQDMPLVAAELLHALVGDAPDGLILVGDDQQRVFPGGFRLLEAGIDVTGRSTRLTRNYRNTYEILAAARSVLTGDDDDLLEGGQSSSDVEVLRHGAEPVFFACESRAALDNAFVGRLHELLAQPSMRPGEVAVLVVHHKEAAYCLRLLAERGIDSAKLEDWDGIAVGGVIVGTNKSAKGLEFKSVLLPNLDSTFLTADEPADDYRAELWRMRKRELYVAMTRARDSLWVGYVCRPPAQTSTATTVRST